MSTTVEAEISLAALSLGLPARPIELPFFLALLAVLSGLPWAPVIAAGSLAAGGGIYVAVGMWTPAVAALPHPCTLPRYVAGTR
jgi:hypothetical protein